MKVDPKNKTQGVRGFTLIEILLVVLLLSVITGLAVPNFSQSYSNFQLQKFTEDLAYTMRYAQSRAVSRNTPVRLEFNNDFSQYWLTQFASPSNETETPGAAPVYEKIAGRYGRIFSTIRGIHIQSLSDHIDFFPDGRIAKQRVYVCREEKCFTISTQEQRGFVDILEGKIE